MHKSVLEIPQLYKNNIPSFVILEGMIHVCNKHFLMCLKFYEVQHSDPPKIDCRQVLKQHKAIKEYLRMIAIHAHVSHLCVLFISELSLSK